MDRAVATVVTAATLAGALTTAGPHPTVFGWAALVILGGSIAFRRSHPAIAATTAISALMAYNLTSSGTPPGPTVAAPILTFYSLGRVRAAAWDTRATATIVAPVGYALIVTQLTRHTSGTSNLGVWIACVLLPAALGVALTRRGAVQRRLQVVGAMLERNAAIVTSRAAGAERDRMARELHDVVAHAVSLMVIQANAADAIFDNDRDGTRQALEAIISSGRDALVELRRIVGSLPSEDAHLGAGASNPQLSQIEQLVQRARCAGLDIDATLELLAIPLPRGVELAAYRIVQEALTNVLKHAGPTHATVDVRGSDGHLEILVTDRGRLGGGVQNTVMESGHGLVGMRERVAVFGGQLSTGALPGGGFRLLARIPIETPTTAPRLRPLSTPAQTRAPRARSGPRILPGGVPVVRKWLDPGINAVLLSGFAAEALTGYRRGPVVVEVAAVVLIPAAAILRRRLPLLLMAVVAGLSAPMVWSPTLTGLYALVLPPYSVGAWGTRRQILAGMTLWAATESFSGLVTRGDRSVGDILSPIAISCIALSAGLAIRRHRVRSEVLERGNAQLAIQSEDQARMAVADERARIARELHVAIAGDVTTMIVQAQAAAAMLDSDPDVVRIAIAAIVATGRPALVEMRRIVGVLRHPNMIEPRHEWSARILSGRPIGAAR
jgi:signal transduction histidine kinase